MKAKKLIEVALPIKEISAESVRDKSIRHGHISTLHLWWARRPLPVCRAIVLASLVPDPEDNLCPQAFRDAVKALLHPENDQITEMLYRPYADIPYTAVYDPMEDTLRNRLMMFIGKFSDTCQKNMLAGKSTSPKEQLAPGSLIKWENKNNPKVLRIARELIFVAYNADLYPELGYETLHARFNESFDAIKTAEDVLYRTVDRHKATEGVEDLEKALQNVIDNFQQQMPSVFDPFAGGGAIPLEAARLGCRSYGNDINPVAHIIEKGSAEFPQRFGKPIIYSDDEFVALYGEEGVHMAQDSDHNILHDAQGYHIPNRLSWDVEYYAKRIIKSVEEELGHLYPIDECKNKIIAYYWARTGTCSNPSCAAEVPLLRQFNLAKSSANKVHLAPHIDGRNISFTIENGESRREGWLNRCVLTCPCCGAITGADQIKAQFKNHQTGTRLISVIREGNERYTLPSEADLVALNLVRKGNSRPHELMPTNDSQNLKIPLWGFDSFGDMYTERQLMVLNALVDRIKNIELEETEYTKSAQTYLAFLIDKLTDYYNSFCTWNTSRETIGHLFSKQAIPMVFDFVETNVFSNSSGCLKNMVDWVLRYLDGESHIEFPCTFQNASSGEKSQFKQKQLTAVVTDPPYYDAISYADLSDFFYVWLKRTLGDVYPLTFATPQTPKTEECTAIKHRHSNSIDKAKQHFEDKLTQIFDAIEEQTSDVVSIMFAHQSTEAWTTLCNSILGARMNITGSWPMDTEMANRSIGLSGAALESSVTVACRPSERRGFGDYKEVKRDIEQKVTEEVESLYELGFRGADLLTACFGQAVSEFGRYKVVEKADGSEVTVAELLEMARTSAFDALLKGVQGDDYTRFYIGWLQLNGTGEVDFDDATKFTRVGVNVNINDIKQRGLLVLDGKKMHLALSEEHIGGSQVEGTRPTDSLIDQAHRAILFWKDGNRQRLLNFVRDCAKETNAPLWRLLATLKELLPASDELKQVEGLLINAEDLRMNAGKILEHKQGDLFADL